MPIDTGTTFIEATGHFGNTKRKIQAKIDRMSGALIGTYNFLLNAENGSITYP